MVIKHYLKKNIRLETQVKKLKQSTDLLPEEDQENLISENINKLYEIISNKQKFVIITKNIKKLKRLSFLNLTKI